jgi:hypothetical protein
MFKRRSRYLKVHSVAQLATFVLIIGPGCNQGTTSTERVGIQRVLARPDPREILVEIDACAQDANISVTEGEGEVRLDTTAFEVSHTESCGYGELVTLLNPLGDRVLIDEVSGSSLQVVKTDGSTQK